MTHTIDKTKVLKEIENNRKIIQQSPGKLISVPKPHLLALCDIIEILIKENE